MKTCNLCKKELEGNGIPFVNLTRICEMCANILSELVSFDSKTGSTKSVIYDYGVSH